MLYLLGDISLNGIICSFPEHNYERFKHVKNSLQNADAVITNLESPIATKLDTNPQKSMYLSTRPEIAKNILSMLNISCVSLANNHILDYGLEGLQKTIDILDELDIKHTGAGFTEKDVNPVIFNYGGNKVGFIAYVDKSTNPKSELYTTTKINYLDIDKIKTQISLLANKVDKIICSLHWGDDYSYYPTQKQIEIANNLTNSGVDVIMGHHPHTLQPFEIKNNKHIYYSLGGITFGDTLWKGNLRAIRKTTKKSVIVEIDKFNQNPNFLSFKELQGNFIIKINFNFTAWTKKKWLIFRLSKKCKAISFFMYFNKKYVVRIVDFFFGYYRTPKIAVKEIINHLRKLN